MRPAATALDSEGHDCALTSGVWAGAGTEGYGAVQGQPPAKIHDMLGKCGSVRRKAQSHKAGGKTDGHLPAFTDSVL